jgi:signal transduction histidine kinase
MISKANFFEVMSQQFMFDVYSRRSANYFFDENDTSNSLMLDANTLVLKASTIALQRPSATRFDPIIVKFSDDCFKLLDYYVLLMAENQLHIQTSILLREANEFKKDVLGVVAHDLRNPISAIGGFANILVEATENDQDNIEYAKIILEASQQMQNMVDDLLVSAINDATDFSVNPSPFGLIRLINQIIANFKEPSELKNQKIHFFYSDNSIQINADSTKLREVIENLISNAIKYSEAGKEIKIYVEKLDQKITIKVADEGPGMNETDKGKVFGKFTRLSAKPTAGESSTGLGLYIVKKLVELHEGKIWVESEVNKGSTFIIELPQNMVETEE